MGSDKIRIEMKLFLNGQVNNNELLI